MKSKFITFALTALFLVSLVSVVSAAVIFTPTDLTATGKAGQTVQVTVNIANTWESQLNTITTNFSNLVKGTKTIDKSNLAVTGLTGLTIDNGQNKNGVLTISIPASQEVGVYTGTVEFFGKLGSGESISRGTLDITLTITESAKPLVCEFNNPSGNIKVSVSDIKNNGEFGSDDEWYLFNPIEVEFTVENKGDEKIENIAVEWGLYNEQTNEWIIEVDDENDFNLKDGDEETMTLSFTISEDDLDVDLEDLEAGDLTIYVIATGDDTETDLSVCASDSETAELILDEDFVITSNIQMTETTQCGSTVEVSADIWNIGENDEDDVSVLVRNDELKLSKEIKVGDISSLDSEKISFTFDVPKNAAEKVYGIKFYVLDEDEDVFQNDNDDESLVEPTLTVSGGCILPSDVTIAAVLDSDAVAGKELVIKTTLTNTGDSETTFNILPTGYNSWATLKDVSDESVTLAKGASEEITITLVPNKDALGDKEFTIQTTFDNKVKEQKISVSITKASGWGGITGSVIGGGSTVVTALIVAIVILVVLIIIVAVSLARRSGEEAE